MEQAQQTTSPMESAPTAEVKSDDVNPNEAVTNTNSEKIIGDEQLSWDELDKIETAAENKEVESKKAEKKEKKEAKKLDTEEKDETDESDESDETKEDVIFKPKASVTKKSVKVSLGKDGDVDIPLETMFELKADGQTKEISLRDLLNRGSGDIAVETRLNEVTKKDQAIMQKGEQLRQYAIDTIDTVKVDPIAGIEMIAQLAGEGNPKEFAGKFFDDLSKMAEQLIGMNEDQARAYRAEMKLNSIESRNNLQTQKQQRMQQEQQKNQEISQVIEKNGMSRQDWFDSREELKQDGYPEDQITSDMIVKQNAGFNAKEILKTGVPELWEKQNDPKINEVLQEAWRDLTNMYVSGHNNKDELKELLRESLSGFLQPQDGKQKVSEEIRTLNEKLNEQGQARVAKSDNSDPLNSRGEKAWDIQDSIWS